MKVTKIIFLVFGLLLLNNFAFTQNSERFVIQYKIDLNDSINRKSFTTKVYGHDLITNDSLRNLHFKTVQQCLFLARIRSNFFHEKNFFDFYGAKGESLDETTSAYERGILPTLYLSYEVIWDKDLQDFHYYPSLQNKDFPFITLQLENEENKPTLSYSPSPNYRELIEEDSPKAKNRFNAFDLYTFSDILVLRMFEANISKVYNYIDKSQTKISNQNEFDKWKLNYANRFSSVLKYNYIYTLEQIKWTQGLRVLNSDENFYYFEEERTDASGYYFMANDASPDYYILAMDTKAPENAKFLLNGESIFVYYLKKFVRENPYNVPINISSPYDNYSKEKKDCIYYLYYLNYSISRNKDKIKTKSFFNYRHESFYDAQKDSVMYGDYEMKFYRYLDSLNTFLAKDYYHLNFTSYMYSPTGKKIIPTSLPFKDIQELLANQMREKINKNINGEDLDYENIPHSMCAYKLLPSKNKKENTLFEHKKELMQQIVEAMKIGILRPYSPLLYETRQSHEDFLSRLYSLETYYGGIIPYEKFDFHVEVPFKAKQNMNEFKFYKADLISTSFGDYLYDYYSIVIPTELSPTKKEYIFIKGSLRELRQNLIENNPELEFKNTFSIEKILTEKLLYGELKRVDFINIERSQSEYPIYDLTNLEDLKKAYPMTEKYIEKVPKTITPESFE